MEHRLALIGFGTVGQGLCEILVDKEEELRKRHDFEAKVVAVCDLQKGSLHSSQGLELPRLLELARAGRSLEEYPGELDRGWNALRTIRDCDADSVCELAYTDIKSGQPATDHCRAAFESGKNLVTSNKGPAALHYTELADLAAAKGVRFGIEGTVMSGTPVLNLARNCLAGNKIRSIRGILNGTTNFILSKMESGRAYDEVLREAQELGYAEAAPTADVEGHDALAKVTILANVLMGASLRPSEIPCEGITEITVEKIERAKAQGMRWKLIGEAKRDGSTVHASVRPTMVDMSHPLAGVMGANNAISFDCDLLGEVTINGPGAGRVETGFSILVDLLEIHREMRAVKP